MPISSTSTEIRADLSRVRLRNARQNLTAFNAGGFGIATAAGLAAINHEVTWQATMIAYVDDFMLMLYATIALAPLVLLIKPARQQSGAPVHAAMD